MRKLKKLSKNKKSAFNFVIIYGTVAVGKFTVAEKLQKLTGYKFFHNHHTHDLARQLFERGSPHSSRIIEKIRIILFKEISKAKVDVITTHTYSPDFVSSTGLTDPKFMKKIESIINVKGGNAFFVHLVADKKEILKRVTGESRNNFKKLKDVNTMKEILDKGLWKISAPIKNNFTIDNTKLSSKKVAEMIIRHYKLK
jgi:shikimate kinase